MQGVSGSGKSTWIRENAPGAIVCSADDYFMIEGEYRFDPSKLGEAHKACLRGWIEALNERLVRCVAPYDSCIVCDNTNTSLWELAPYVQTAAALGYEVTVVRCVAPTALAASRNLHGVPAGTVEAMACRLEKPLPFWPCEFREVITG